MSDVGKKFLAKKVSDINLIMYICRKNNKSVLYFSNGNTLETFIPIKGMLDELPSSLFVVINKGLAINMNYVKEIKKNIYIMNDGRSFEGRVRNIGAHNRNASIVSQSTRNKSYDSTPLSAFKVFDNFPSPFCVVEAVFDKHNHGIDLKFRYCNKAMSKFNEMPNEALIGHSFDLVFKNVDPKWLISIGDIALNGGSRIIHDNTRQTRFCCYQPFPGMVGCMLVPENVPSSHND